MDRPAQDVNCCGLGDTLAASMLPGFGGLVFGAGLGLKGRGRGRARKCAVCVRRSGEGAGWRRGGGGRGEEEEQEEDWQALSPALCYEKNCRMRGDACVRRYTN